MIHRFSFNESGTPLVDSVGSASGTVYGTSLGGDGDFVMSGKIVSRARLGKRAIRKPNLGGTILAYYLAVGRTASYPISISSSVPSSWPPLSMLAKQRHRRNIPVDTSLDSQDFGDAQGTNTTGGTMAQDTIGTSLRGSRNGRLVAWLGGAISIAAFSLGCSSEGSAAAADRVTAGAKSTMPSGAAAGASAGGASSLATAPHAGEVASAAASGDWDQFACDLDADCVIRPFWYCCGEHAEQFDGCLRATAATGDAPDCTGNDQCPSFVGPVDGCQCAPYDSDDQTIPERLCQATLPQ